SGSTSRGISWLAMAGASGPRARVRVAAAPLPSFCRSARTLRQALSQFGCAASVLICRRSTGPRILPGLSRPRAFHGDDVRVIWLTVSRCNSALGSEAELQATIACARRVLSQHNHRPGGCAVAHEHRSPATDDVAHGAIKCQL